MAEIIVIHGPPGSGKSVHSERLANEGLRGRVVEHVSAGNRLRSIRTGEIVSAYRDVVNPAPGTRVLLDHNIMTGVIFEYVNQMPSTAIVLVDGYPRFVEAIPGFKETAEKEGHALLGCINLNISKRVSLDRVLGRGTRVGEINVSSELVKKRYQEHLDYTVPTVRELKKIVEVVSVDAESDMGEVWGQFYQAVLKLTTDK